MATVSTVSTVSTLAIRFARRPPPRVLWVVTAVALALVIGMAGIGASRMLLSSLAPSTVTHPYPTPDPDPAVYSTIGR